MMRKCWVLVGLLSAVCLSDETTMQLLDDAKSSRTALDASKKALEAAVRDVESMRSANFEDGVELEGLQRDAEELSSLGLSTTADFGRLVVFMQRCEGAECLLSKDLNTTEAQLRILLSATATKHTAALETRLSELLADRARLEVRLERAAYERSTAAERCDDALYRLSEDADKREKEKDRLYEAEKKATKSKAGVEADFAAVKKDVEELQRQRSWECDVVTSHAGIAVDAGQIVILRIYQPTGHEEELWWALAEVVSLLEGDGIHPSSLLQFRLFKDPIKSPTKYALDGGFERDLSSVGLVAARRDAVAYVDVAISGSGDPGGGTFPAMEEGAIRGAKKDPKKAAKRDRTGGLRIAEREKRFILNRLDRDDLSWARRDTSLDHATKGVEVGMSVVYRYVPAPGELWFSLATVLSVDDKQQGNVTLSPLEPSLGYPLNKTLLEEKFFAQPDETVNVPRTDLAFVDLATSSTNRAGDQTTVTVKSTEKKRLEKVLDLDTARWWVKLGAEMDLACPEQRKGGWTTTGWWGGSSSEGAAQKRRQPPPLKEEAPELSVLAQRTLLLLNSSEACDVVLNATDAADIEALGPRLENMKRKLAWLADVATLGLVTEQQREEISSKILAQFLSLGPPADTRAPTNNGTLTLGSGLGVPPPSDHGGS